MHGDFRADNLLFGPARPVVLDWQTASFGAGTGDLAYFLGSSLLVPLRQEHEERSGPRCTTRSWSAAAYR